MKTKLLVLITFVLVVTNGWAQSSYNHNSHSNQNNISTELFKILPNASEIDVRKDVKEAVFLEIDFAELTRIYKEKPSSLILDLPLSVNSKETFYLNTAKILADDFSVINEKKERVAYTPGIYYQGTVSGITPSLAAFSLFDNSVMAVFSYNNENYVLGLWNDKSNIHSNIYILYKDSDVLHAMELKCGINNLPKKLAGSVNPGHLLSNQCIKVYFETDYQMFQDKGSAINVTNYVTGVFNVVSQLYATEIVSTEISQIFVWTTTDPYISNATSSDYLNAFQATRTTFNGNLAHLLTTRNLNIGGIGYIDVLCSPGYAYAFSNIENTYSSLPTYSNTVFIITHEMGHNIGSEHTHWCLWSGGPIDDCAPVDAGPCAAGPHPPPNGGTLMSYCNLNVGTALTNGFGTQPGNKIRARYAAASCLTPCMSPPIVNFSASPVSSCSAPQVVTFTDLSLASPTSWAWDIDNNGTTDYTTQNPTHTYTTAGTYSVKLTATNSNGPGTITKLSYITIGSATLPFTEGFENATFPPGGWSKTQSPTDSLTWFRNTTAAGNGTSTACAYVAYYDYNTHVGAKDNLISKPVSLVGVSVATMTFKVAYKYYGPTNSDTLRVFVSTNCGATYGAAVYTKGGTGLATSGSGSTVFTPTVAGDWRTETVSLTPFVGGSVVVKFEGTNRYGNNLYLDDINIVSGAGTVPPVAKFLASDTTICVGDCISFTDQSTNTPSTWAWTFSGAATTSSAVQNPTNICYNAQGTYNVSLVSSNSGGNNTKTKVSYIVVSPQPTVPTISQSGNTLTSSAAVSYQWYKNGTAITGATLIAYTATSSGSYTVTIVNANGCSATSLAKVITITGINENSDEATTVIIYPDPFSTSAIIKIESTNKNIKISEMNFILYDMIGKEVMRIDSMNDKTELSRQQLSTGFYFYKVFNKQQLVGKGKVEIQ